MVALSRCSRFCRWGSVPAPIQNPNPKTQLTVGQVEERIKENDKMKALSLLLAIGNSGRHYKELICEHSGVKVVVDCLVQSKNETLQEETKYCFMSQYLDLCHRFFDTQVSGVTRTPL